MNHKNIVTSSIILLAKTDVPNRYIFGAYKNSGEATSFLQLPEDHKLFVETLTDQQTVMGRKTLQATPDDFPDAGRICITHYPNEINKGAIPAGSLSKGIEIAKRRAVKTGKNSVFVIGGASIIRQCLKEGLLDEICLTLTYDHQKPVSHPVYLDFTLKEWTIKEDSGILISKDSQPKNLKYRYLRLGKE